jgi:hypothetical protein
MPATPLDDRCGRLCLSLQFGRLLGPG